MKYKLKENRESINKYITHVFLNKQRVIPSDSFVIENNEYLLLEILNSSENEIYLKIIGIGGKNTGNIYFIPKKEFEDKTLSELKKSLRDYQH